MSNRRYPCPVCGYLTLDEEPPGTFNICPVCFWEDDSVQANDAGYRGGANVVSLNEAKANYASCGASEQRFRENVRPPRPEEMPG